VPDKIYTLSVLWTGVTGEIVFNEPERDRMLNYRVLDMHKNGTFYNLFQFLFISGGNDKEMKYVYVSIPAFAVV